MFTIELCIILHASLCIFLHASLFTGSNVFFLSPFADSEIFEGFLVISRKNTPFAIHSSSVTTGMIRLVGSIFLFKGAFWFHSSTSSWKKLYSANGKNQKHQLHVTYPNSAVSFALCLWMCISVLWQGLERRNMRESFSWKIWPGTFPQSGTAMICIRCWMSLDPSHCHSFATNGFLKSDTLYHGCTHYKRQNTHPMQHVKNHLMVAVLMDDARKGIEHQIDPFRFSSSCSISLLTSLPFEFSFFHVQCIDNVLQLPQRRFWILLCLV